MWFSGTLACCRMKRKDSDMRGRAAGQRTKALSPVNPHFPSLLWQTTMTGPQEKGPAGVTVVFDSLKISSSTKTHCKAPTPNQKVHPLPSETI